ncbi:MAG: rhomboid family intramembrane serine protease [Rhizobiales bacterium]|nr:rhomboid family intramembrane serine protease [Hyphomicrobiales bacterium]
MRRVYPILLFVGAIWIAFLLDRFLPLERFGLVPRSFDGLTGIVAMPFLHGNLAHLVANTLPLIVLLALMVASRPRPWPTMILLILLSGAALWLFGRPALHIGASGMIYALMGFLIAAGLLERRPVPAVVALVVGLTYGTSILGGILPWQPGVSWEGHLFGLLAGAALAWNRSGPATRS